MPTPRAEASPPGTTADATTRYLCAAAHLDASFADAAIREYLLEPTRALPPSPGLDASAVLRDAVAARTRRKIRDAALLVLLVVFAWLSATLTVLWLATAVGVAVLTGHARRAGRNVVLGAVAVVLLLALTALAQGVVALFGAGLGGYGYGYGYGYDYPALIGLVPFGAVGVALLILGVCAADEFAVTELTRRRFRTDFRADPATLLGWEHTIRTLGHDAWQSGLRRVAATAAPPPGTAEVIVYRTRHPFVGAGEVWRRKTLPLPLKPADENGEEPRPIGPAQLLETVAAVVDELRRSATLAPSARLHGLEIMEQVLVPSTRLVRNRFAPAVSDILPTLSDAPRPWLPHSRATELADRPDEVARLHRCFRIEAWDRDLTVSCFLTASVDRRTLYLEWTHCVLAPIREQYRSIDYVDEAGPGRRALLAAVLLPVTAVSRLASAARMLRPARVRAGEVDPDLYGAGKSLREHAAEPDRLDHFQVSDAERYIVLLEQALLRGVAQYLEANGYSVAMVRQIANQTITNSITINGGDQRGATIANTGATQHNSGVSGSWSGAGSRSGNGQ